MFSLTSLNGNPVAVAEADKIVMGTCMLGDDYGTVKSATLTRTGQEEEILGCKGQIVAWLIKNPGFELQMEVRFDSDVDPPEILDSVTFPLAEVTGHVAPGTQIKWEEGGVRVMSFTAKNWDSMSSVTAMTFNDSTGLLESISVSV
jgi:hypothetical protein